MECVWRSSLTMWRNFKSNMRSLFTTDINLSPEQLEKLGEGGGGGTVKEAEGASGGRQLTEEEMNLKRIEKEQLAAQRKYHIDEINNHMAEIKRLKQQIKDLKMEIMVHEGMIRKHLDA